VIGRPEIKKTIRSLLHRLGYDVRRLGAEHNHHADPFFDQQRLLRNVAVPHIFDVGANTGQTVEQYQRLFRDAEIYCFEPFEQPFNTLREKFRRSPRVLPVKLALSDSTGSRPFYLNSADVTNSLLPVAKGSELYVDPTMTREVGRIDVETTTLDEFCAAHNIQHINILKMDIQGAEMAALRGATGLLQRQAIDVVYSEILFAQLYENQTNFCDLYKHLESMGYRLYGLYGLNYGKNQILAWGDALFIGRTIREKVDAMS
jgi:FkbM family methyltransferase